MKKLKFLLTGFAALMLALGQASCSSDDPKPSDKPEPEQPSKPDTPDNPDEPEEKPNYHFDLWVALDRHGGMGRDVQTLVKSMEALNADQPVINFEGTGTEVNAVLTLETILKGKYYYQVPVAGTCFGKYVIKDNRIETIAERQFKDNTYSARKYTHAWIGENTLLIMAADGDAEKIIWTKLNAEDLSIIAEGTLDIQIPAPGKKLTTSGIAAYRKSDNKLFYFYYAKADGKRAKRVTPMYTAVINPETMAVESNKPCFLDCEMVGSAYGELLQNITMIDGNDNLYVACFSTETDETEKSHLLKIPAGSTDFDPSYDGFTSAAKLNSIIYIGENKALAYAREDGMENGIDDFSYYYSVIDLTTIENTPVSIDGKRLPFSSGRFSSRMAAVDGKAYLGVDAEGVNPVIYIYNVADGTTVKGAEMDTGYFFEQIRVVENL